MTWESDVLKQLTHNKGGGALGGFDKHGTVNSSLEDDYSYLGMISEVGNAVGKNLNGGDPFAEPSSIWTPPPGHPAATTTLPQQLRDERLPIGQRSVLAGGGAGAGGRRMERDIDLNSVLADRSLVESLAPTIDTVNLEHIAEQLLSSDEVMRILAKRLGLPEDQIVPADELSSVFSMESNHYDKDDEFQLQNNQRGGGGGRGNPLNAPRDNEIDIIDEQEYHSDDDIWSINNDDEVGDYDYEKYLNDDQLPQNQMESAALKRQEMKERFHFGESDNHSVPSNVPYLNLDPITGTSNIEIEHNQERYGWRRLPRPQLTTAFLTNALKTHVRGPDPTSCNTTNAPVFLSPISPVDAIQYVPERHTTSIESLFIQDAKKDMERSIAVLKRNIAREEELSRNLPTDDLLLFGEAKEFTSADQLIAKQYNQDKAAITDPKEMAKDQAILAAKATNIAQMEDALAEDIPINTADDFGNTLLILSAQQGSKRMCKFLLRRGANINIQNLSGNTALHYCYAYTNLELADYLKTKVREFKFLICWLFLLSFTFFFVFFAYFLSLFVC
jgi:hypothetical protein